MSEAPIRDGQLIRPAMASAGGYHMKCCDCGLVHRLDFQNLMEGDIEADPHEVELVMRVYRDDAMTAKARAGSDTWWLP
jgi:hypothetical protein